jgi:hypothetical protein
VPPRLPHWLPMASWQTLSMGGHSDIFVTIMIQPGHHSTRDNRPVLMVPGFDCPGFELQCPARALS